LSEGRPTEDKNNGIKSITNLFQQLSLLNSEKFVFSTPKSITNSSLTGSSAESNQILVCPAPKKKARETLHSDTQQTEFRLGASLKEHSDFPMAPQFNSV